MAYVAADADDPQKTQVAIHVPELDERADRVLPQPLCARERFTDHGNVRRGAVVAVLEQAASQKRNAYRLKETLARGAILCLSDALRIFGEPLEIVERLDELAGLHDDKEPVAKARAHRQTIDSTRARHAGDRSELPEKLGLQAHQALALGVHS